MIRTALAVSALATCMIAMPAAAVPDAEDDGAAPAA